MQKLFIIIVILLSITVNCTSLKRSFKKSSEISLSQNYHFDKFRRVTIFPFITNKPERHNFHISDQLSTQLMKRGYIVIERSQLETILHELKIELTGIINRDDILRIGKLLQIDALIMGSLEYDYQDNYWWLISGSMRMIDVTTGELIVSVYSNAWDADIQYVINDIMNLMDLELIKKRYH